MKGPISAPPFRLLLFSLLFFALAAHASAQSAAGPMTRQIDAAVRQRAANVAGFTDIEHYVVYRGKDETHPAAEITVKATFRRGEGRSYRILSQSGSEVIRKLGLIRLLKEEKALSQPGALEQNWLNSTNYQMSLKSDKPEQINGHLCYAISIVPKRRAPETLIGTLWVDADDYAAIRIDGVPSRRPSIFAGSTRITRDYEEVHGYSMATFARAESNSRWIGRTVITVSYSHYHLFLRSDPALEDGVIADSRAD